MDDEQAELYFQAMRRQIAGLQNEDGEKLQEIEATLEDLQAIYTEMQLQLKAADALRQRLFQQNQQIAANYYHYHNLFHSFPIACLVTNPLGIILEANQAIAQRLNVSQQYLLGEPLAVYVAEADRSAFLANLGQLAQSRGIQIWQITLCPQAGSPFTAELHLDVVREDSGLIKGLRVGVYDVSRSQQQIVQIGQPQIPETSQAEGAMLMTQLPQSLDGLRVLVVDDEPDTREFVAAVLQSHGIFVQVVADAAAALQAIEQFHPDVLVSDIRMPGEDGYSLIRQIRALEAERGGHLPAGAMTAYLEEDRVKTLTAGYEAHLHKLAQPIEWIEMVAQLASRRQEA